ncbi:hypothetical protein GE21DRAFT_5338 [Neurospora crassa]|uniref:Uncharacterized protein n=1 Tax=Neurospora crassa (strain ATCC 24698 / 74-OR23-1A / CBS 708.71 / DSM 1257 / FGSC 987) TaxID=367110 RepID=Q7S1E5_NEUCR|nr:hypothetical protein NCU04890 [Neurospora crassa OR74A]EAA29163.1 hypothetical protein NCU04890 [Neurospora crassa OR74A]KHE78851.1 hypothetical protein GE21DRAFT_5338 [Neurospora crassa]|eukprot:XP_958399.1 hypothetical protein NCU04890 [Neurospora crassa OR74A]
MVFTMDSTWDSDSCDLDEGLSIPGRIGASNPPAVYSFADLHDFRNQIKDVVVIAVDFECVDHLGKEFGQDFFGKMSEIGIATYDPRQSKTSSGAISKPSLESIAKAITAEHIIIDQWKGITERTCPAFYHRKNTKQPHKAPAPHKARPYHCMFARSTIGLSKEQGVERLKDVLRQATVSNLTADEMKTGAERQVRIIVWCAEMEEKIFSQAGVNLDDLGSDIKMWDFQIWMPFRLRFPNYRTAGETVFASLGVVGALDPEGHPSTVLHNATNDTVAEVLAFLGCMVMAEAEWGAWLNEKVDLTPISFDWVDKTIYEHNIAQSPTPKSKGKGRGKPRVGQSYNTREPRKDTATKCKSPPKTTYTTKPAPLDVNNATSYSSVRQEAWMAESTSSCGNNWDRNDDWADNSNIGWPADTWTTDGTYGTSTDNDMDWVNRSGSGWPDNSSPSSNDSGDLTANFSGWPPEMDDRSDASDEFTGWPDDVSDVDDSEDTSAGASGWPADMDYPEIISTLDSSEHTKTDTNNENVPSASMSVGCASERNEWQTVHHLRRGKKKTFNAGAYRR